MKIHSLLLVTAVSFAFGSSVWSLCERNAYTTANLSIRSCPSTGCGRIGIIPSQTPVYIEQCREGWCRVSYGMKKGFSAERYISYAGPLGGGSASNGCLKQERGELRRLKQELRERSELRRLKQKLRKRRELRRLKQELRERRDRWF